MRCQGKSLLFINHTLLRDYKDIASPFYDISYDM